MQKLIIAFLLTFTCSFYLKSQDFEQELKTSLKTKPKVDFRLDSRSSFISTSGVRIFGVKLGLQYNNKLSIGLGYNQLISGIENKSIDFDGVKYTGNLQYNYVSPYIEYIFYEDRKWELSIPVQFGFGNAFYENTTDAGPKRFNVKRVVSYEPAITFQYRILKYFGAGMGVGYRLMIIPNNEIKERFTSPVYLFKFKFYFQELYSDFLDK